MNGTTTRVLLVEDNPGDARLICEALRDARPGVCIEIAHVGLLTEALARLAAGPCDAVLLDLSLPDAHDLSALEELHERYPELPIVILTGLDDEERCAEALQRGAQDYLVKGSVDGDAIVRSIRYAIARAAAEQERSARIREQAARLEAEAAQRAREDFLIAAAHDLRTPLTIIRGYTQVLLRRATPDTAELLRLIDAAGQRMHAGLTELLDLARAPGAALPCLHRVPTDLVPLMRRIAAEQERMSGRHRIHVCAPAELLVECDAARIERAFANLLGNAVKYSPPETEITVQLAHAPPHATIRIVDRGVGIPTDDLPHVFERFHRGSNVAGRVAGLGIGLTAARQTIEQHGGSIAIESAEGCGTTVTVRLPALDARALPENGYDPSQVTSPQRSAGCSR